MSGNLATKSSAGCYATNKRYLIVLNLIFVVRVPPSVSRSTRGRVPASTRLCGCVLGADPAPPPPWLRPGQIMGSALVGVASWGQQHQAQLSGIVPEGGFNLAIAAGSILLIISVSGVIGTLASFYKCSTPLPPPATVCALRRPAVVRSRPSSPLTPQVWTLTACVLQLDLVRAHHPGAGCGGRPPVCLRPIRMWAVALSPPLSCPIWRLPPGRRTTTRTAAP